MINPWLGLSSYNEDSLKEHQFYGRSSAIASMSSLIRQNLFVTLYGRSGIGKTSLLQAGVFPVIRREGYYPVIIRLSQIIDGVKSASKVIWHEIIENLESHGFSYMYCDIDDEYTPEYDNLLFFREILSAGRFVNKEGEEAIPVIVLDQFEEILYNAPNSARLLVSQLYALIDDSYDLRISHPNWHEDTNFRLVVSIREDDLFLFEDIIDTLYCNDFKNNRYRLLPLSYDEAKDVILKPIENNPIFEKESILEIVDEIINLSKGSSQTINTLLLSLLCYVLFRDSITNNRKISISNLKDYKDILETYYKEVIKEVPKKQRYYLEDHLVDGQGRRTSIYMSDFEKNAPQAKPLIENSNQRILNENQGRVELIHDQLAVSVMKQREERKSKKTKQFGISILVLFLLGLFLFSFSHLPDKFNEKSYKDAPGLVFDVNAESMTINDTLICIYDCPALKKIRINNPKASVIIYNCPSLVDVDLPANYRGLVIKHNCPNLDDKDGKIVPGVRDISDIYKSEHGFNWIYCEGVFDYNSSLNRIIVKRLPLCGSGIGKSRVPTTLPDSVKKKTDCYVPFGYKKLFSQLNEYKPFRSINELPIYYTWEYHASGIIKVLVTEKYTLAIIVFGLSLVLLIFYQNSRQKSKSILAVYIIPLMYGLSMVLLATLSFMAFYWFVFNFAVPCNRLISTISGLLGCIICIFIVYKNSFYSLWLSYKNNGLKGVIKEITNRFGKLSEQSKNSLEILKIRSNRFIPFVKKNYRPVIAVSLILLMLGGFSFWYIRENSKRDYYLEQINEIVYRGEYSRAYAIIEELEKQHASVIFPSFKEELNSIKFSISGDSISLYHKITYEYIHELASKKDIHFEPFKIKDLVTISNDGTKFAIRVEYPKANDLRKDLYQVILVDMHNQVVEEITPKTAEWYHDFKGSFSPTGNTLLLAHHGKLYLYLSTDGTKKEIQDGLSYSIDDIMAKNDSVYYLTNYGSLYKGDINGGAALQIYTKEYISRNLTMISNNLIGATGNYSEIIIYNEKKDSIYFHSRHQHIGDVRTINKDYAITSKGLYDIARDSLINENENLYEYKNQVVELRKYVNKYSFYDLKGNEIVEISVPDGESLSNIKISKDGNFIICDGYETIDIYSVMPIADRNWSISSVDKETFNLK